MAQKHTVSDIEKPMTTYGTTQGPNKRYRRLRHPAFPAAVWTDKNPLLQKGEIGAETDTFRAKIGDGVTYWNDLPYLGEGASANIDLSNLSATGKANISAVGTYNESGTYSAGTVGKALQGKLNLDGSNTMTGVLKMRASISFQCAIAPYWDGVGFYKLNDNDSVTLMASMESTQGFTPFTTNTYDIGMSSKKWKNLYLGGKAYVGTINNGADITVPATGGTMALTSDIPTVPTDVSAFVNDAGYITNTVNDLTNYTLSSSLSAVATSGLYSDLSGTPTIPTVNDSTISITQNGASVGSFTLNQASGDTIALTDTTYSAMTGATAGDAGTSGLVPAPAAGDQDKVLKGDATWATPSVAWGNITGTIGSQTDLQNALNDKADTDVSNLTATGKSRIVDFATPDYASVITGTVNSSTWTQCAKTSFVCVWGMDPWTEDYYVYVSPDNGTTTYTVGRRYDDVNSNTQGTSFTFIVPAGWSFLCQAEQGSTYYIYPLKGVA